MESPFSESFLKNEIGKHEEKIQQYIKLLDDGTGRPLAKKICGFTSVKSGFDIIKYDPRIVAAHKRQDEKYKKQLTAYAFKSGNTIASDRGSDRQSHEQILPHGQRHQAQSSCGRT